MATTSVNDIDLGTIITFRSKNPTDTVLWRGSLLAKVTYDIAKAYENPAAFHQGVRQVDQTVPLDVKDLTYFIIKVDNDQSVATTKIYAQEWILPGSLSVVSVGNKVRLQVDDPKNNTQLILSILANAGYSAKII